MPRIRWKFPRPIRHPNVYRAGVVGHKKPSRASPDTARHSTDFIEPATQNHKPIQTCNLWGKVELAGKICGGSGDMEVLEAAIHIDK